MRRAALACVGLVLVTSSASAQFWVRPFVPPGFGPVFPGRAMCAFGYPRPWGGFGPFSGGFGYQSTTIVVIPPVYLPTPPLMDVDQTRDLARLLGRLPQAPPREELALLRPVAAPAPARPAARKVPRFAPEPAPRAPLLAPPARNNNPDEADRQTQLGRDAFAAGAPGRALERFQQTTRLVPERPLPRFLAVQALMALARYREAAATLIDALKRQPAGPGPELNPRDLYGRDVGAHALDLDRLRQSVEQQPDEPALQFLLGYQLWINGRRAEARPHLERAAERATEPEPIRRLMAAPGR